MGFETWPACVPSRSRASIRRCAPRAEPQLATTVLWGTPLRLLPLSRARFRTREWHAKMVQCKSTGKKQLASPLSPKAPSRVPPELPRGINTSPQLSTPRPFVAVLPTRSRELRPANLFPLRLVRSPPPFSPSGWSSPDPRSLGARGLAYLAWCGRSPAPRSHEAAPSRNPGESKNPAQHE